MERRQFTRWKSRTRRFCRDPGNDPQHLAWPRRRSNLDGANPARSQSWLLSHESFEAMNGAPRFRNIRPANRNADYY
jgi:hypothetical protein